MSDIINYVKGFDLFGIKSIQIPCLTGSGEPSVDIADKIGLLYINEDNGDMYKCINGTNGLVWDRITNDSAKESNYNTETGELVIDDASYDEATGELII